MMYQLCPGCLRALTATGYIDAPFPYECFPCGRFFVAVYAYRDEHGEYDSTGAWMPVFFEARGQWGAPSCSK